MSADFTALSASVVAGLPEVTACLMLSRDGLALGCHPPAEEVRAMERWARLAAMGEVERGFVVIGGELWVFVRRGRYGALAVAEPAGRPGAVLVELEEAVEVAEQAGGRKRRDPGAAGRESGERGRRRRISLHPARERTAAAQRTRREAKAPSPSSSGPTEVPTEIDRLDLVREFGGLLGSPDEDSS